MVSVTIRLAKANGGHKTCNQVFDAGEVHDMIQSCCLTPTGLLCFLL